VELGLKHRLSLDTVEVLIGILKSYKEKLDKFYLDERKDVHQKFAFQFGGELQEKFEVESQLYKVTSELQIDIQAVIFSIEKTEEKFGPVTVLVNNAGVGIFKPLEELTEKDFRLTFEIDELGVFLGMKTVVPSMKKANGGSIVNISSVDGLVSAPTAIAYSASKHAVTGMTKGAATELGQYGIRVNSVHPGVIESPMAEQGDVAEFIKKLEQDIPLRRRAKAEEVSNLVIYLASDDSSYSTGSQFVVDGGMISDL